MSKLRKAESTQQSVHRTAGGLRALSLIQAMNSVPFRELAFPAVPQWGITQAVGRLKPSKKVNMAYMNKAAYWFLDAVVEYQLPIRMLVASNLAEVLNRPSHDLDPQSICALLLQLVQQDYLVIYQCNPHEHREVPFIPTLRDLKEELDTPKSNSQVYLSYGISPLGGAQWESLSSPRWDRFLSASYAIDPYEAEIIAQDRQLVQRYFELQHYISSSVGVVIPESLQWDTLHPWQATYWKTLPQACRLRFFYSPYTEDIEVPAIPTWAWEQFCQLREWYQRYSPREDN